jgi:HEPN domain-containing protein
LNKEENISYWIESSDNNAVTMHNLFNSKDYDWSLFIGHLVIEKLLKAYFVKHRDGNYPQIHDLLRLADRAGLILSDEQKDILDEVTGFNISVRYEDYKKEFRNKCTAEFAKEYIDKIDEFRKWIKKQL